ncbi:PEP-CTERM sorting domain-containing protein [Cerasicoccus frondis]|uniref:PEP-CTERM sorting domain-containing protein n=1 Tax=Cerasicoccus frondis TaxID=490090 RepID=UPI00285286F6|nr:PEP-CTERM sorting domain-containing protein [Cerasicoccus frondis]
MNSKLPLLGALWLAISIPLSADTLLSYGGDYISDSVVSFSRSATSSGSGPYTYTLNYDLDEVLSPSSNYTGPVFYGGYQFSSSTVDGQFSRQQIRNSDPLDRIYLQTYSPTGWDGSTLSLHAAFLFKQEDFLPGYQSGANLIEGLSMSSNSFGAGTGRFLVEVGGSFYVSNSTMNVSGTTSLVLDAAALSTETWAAYDPFTSLNFDQNSSFGALALENVTGAGFYVERDSFAGSAATTPFGMGIETFEVVGITVPEPSVYALLLGAVVLGGALMRRRYR